MKLAFREFGSGQPLIILHGLFGQSDNWNTLAKSFAEKGFRVFTLDQRNHGLSPHSDEWTYESMASDLKEFIDDHGLEKPVIIGHSMGGKTVMFFETMYPGIADKLIIVDIAARPYPRHHDDVLEALHAVDFNTIKNRKDAEAIMNKYISDFGTKQFLLKNIYWKQDDRMDWRFNLDVITRNYDNVSVAVPQIASSVPALIINGGKSRYISAQDVEEFRMRFPNSQFVTIQDSGHWVHAEKPKEFFDAVMAFIAA